jgi:transposase
MFLRRHRRHSGGETYEYWSLVKTVRTARGPRQEVVARLGKLDGTEVASARGYSRDQRPDCKQVCIGLVVSPEGLALAYEVFAGNRNDVTTLEDIVKLMEEKYGQPRRVWVLDRGIVSEKNLAWLRERGASYLVGTPKSQLKAHHAALLEKPGWQEARPGVEVKLIKTPEGSEQFLLCRSTDRAAKERAMLERQLSRLRTALAKIDRGLRGQPEADLEKAGRRIGRWLGKYPAAAAVLIVRLTKNTQGHASGLQAPRNERAIGMGAAGPRSVFAAHQPSERGSRALMAVVYPTDAG